MATLAPKESARRSSSMAEDAAKTAAGPIAAHFADNRPEAAQQQTLQNLINGSAQVAQLRAVQTAADAYTARSLPAQGQLITASLPAAPVLQAKWVKVRHSGDPGQYYWDSPAPQTGAPPPGATQVAPPAHESLPDVHAARSGGSMKSLRTIPDYEGQRLDELAHFGSQAADSRGLFYKGPLEHRGLGPRQVQGTIPPRDSGEHTRIFRQMTGGETSSTSYQQSLGTALPGTSYQILHALGHGEGGAQTQDRRNLSSASEGANSEMIPFDKAISGNTSVVVDSYARVRPGTERAESMHMSYAHRDFPTTPFFSRDIDGDTPKPTRSQYERWKAEAPKIPSDPDDFFLMASLLNLSQQPPRPKDDKKMTD